ncbi:hypothetical protein M758_11G065900 [Ceratodon purpureus]|nr:hypothetical protein M758_11G065900 [Ceratodon purpureus]
MRIQPPLCLRRDIFLRDLQGSGESCESCEVFCSAQVARLTDEVEQLTEFGMATELERLDVGGTVFSTTRSTLTKRDKGSVLALLISRSCREKRSVMPRSAPASTFIDRDGTHFRHVLNWLRDGVVTPELDRTTYHELRREAEYYELPGLVEAIKVLLVSKCEEEDTAKPEMRRLDVIKCLQFGNVRMRGVDLSGQNLSKLDLSGVDFSHCRLINTNFEKSNLQDANFTESEATGANFKEANLKACKFAGASMIGAGLSGANLAEANLDNAKLEKVDLSIATLGKASLCMANLSSADLKFADFTNANLSGSDLRSALLHKTVLNYANLSGADLRSADLSTANFQNADLSGAQLSGPQLLGAILDGAHLSKASAKKKSTRKKASVVDREKESVRSMQALIELGNDTMPIEC